MMHGLKASSHIVHSVAGYIALNYLISEDGSHEQHCQQNGKPVLICNKELVKFLLLCGGGCGWGSN